MGSAKKDLFERQHLSNDMPDLRDGSPIPFGPMSRKLNVQLKLSYPDFFKRNGLFSVYLPRLQRYPLPQDVMMLDEANLNTEWKDITRVWKGMSLDQASEIVLWEQCVLDVLEDYTTELIMKSFQNSYKHAKDIALPERGRLMEDFIGDIGTTPFDIDPTRLVERVMNLFKFRSRSAHHNWLADSHDPYEAVANFLTTLDCFAPSTATACRYTVSLHGIYVFPHDLHIEGSLHWYPPKPFFLNLHPAERTEFFLTPRYKQYKFSSIFEDYAVRVHHEASSEDVSFSEWDDELGTFRAWVDEPFDNEPSVVYINVTTTATKHFPCGVRFERVMRCRITLGISRRATVHHAASMPRGVRPTMSVTSMHRGQTPWTYASQLHTPRSVPNLRRRPEINVANLSVRSSRPANVLRDISQHSHRVQGTGGPTYSCRDDNEETQNRPLSPVSRPQSDFPPPYLAYSTIPSQLEVQAEATHPRLAATFRKADADRERQRAKLQAATTPESRWAQVPTPTTVRMMTGRRSPPSQPSNNHAGITRRIDSCSENLPDYDDGCPITHAEVASIEPSQSRRNLPSRPIPRDMHKEPDSILNAYRASEAGRYSKHDTITSSAKASSSPIAHIRNSTTIQSQTSRPSEEHVQRFPFWGESADSSSFSSTRSHQESAREPQTQSGSDAREHHHRESTDSAYLASCVSTLHDFHARAIDGLGRRGIFESNEQTPTRITTSDNRTLDHSPPSVLAKRSVSPTATVSPAKQLRRNKASQNLRETTNVERDVQPGISHVSHPLEIKPLDSPTSTSRDIYSPYDGDSEQTSEIVWRGLLRPFDVKPSDTFDSRSSASHTIPGPLHHKDLPSYSESSVGDMTLDSTTTVRMGMHGFFRENEACRSRLEATLSPETYKCVVRHAMRPCMMANEDSVDTSLQVSRTRRKNPQNVFIPRNSLNTKARSLDGNTRVTSKSLSDLNRHLDRILEQRGRNPSDKNWFATKSSHTLPVSHLALEDPFAGHSRRLAKQISDATLASTAFSSLLEKSSALPRCAIPSARVPDRTSAVSLHNQMKHNSSLATKRRTQESNKSDFSIHQKHEFANRLARKAGPEKPHADSSLYNDYREENTIHGDSFTQSFALFPRCEPIKTSNKFAVLERLTSGSMSGGEATGPHHTANPGEATSWATNSMEHFSLPSDAAIATAVPDEAQAFQYEINRRLAATSAEAHAGSSPHKRLDSLTPSISSEDTPHSRRASTDDVQAQIQRNYQEFQSRSSEARSLGRRSGASDVSVEDDASARMERLFLEMESFSDERSDQDMTA